MFTQYEEYSALCLHFNLMKDDQQLPTVIKNSQLKTQKSFSLKNANCTASCESPRFQILHTIYFVQNVQKYRRYKEFEIYVEISTGTTISQEMLKQTVNKNNIHVPVGVSQVSQLVVMILLINDCYVMSLVVIISRMNFVLYRNTNEALKSTM